jgi:diaminopimelate epimerase
VSVRVNMGIPRIRRDEIPMIGTAGVPVIAEPLSIGNQTLSITCVSMGNPHCVTFVDDVESCPVSEIGPLVERNPAFPAKTNVEFIQILNPGEIRMRVWERGAGETLACGTGACASVVASILNGKTERSVTVHLNGGDLKIEWPDDDSPVMMTGPAVEVFTGEFPLS